MINQDSLSKLCCFDVQLEMCVLTRACIDMLQENSLVKIGGANLKDTVKRAMGHLLTTDVALLFNWAGRKGWKMSPATSPKQASAG